MEGEKKIMRVVRRGSGRIKEEGKREKLMMGRERKRGKG